MAMSPYFDAAALGSAEGPSPASTHCGRARIETWSWPRNEATVPSTRSSAGWTPRWSSAR